MAELEALQRQLQSLDVEARCEAARQLAMLEHGARPAALLLVDATCDQDEGVREWACEALEVLGAPAEGDWESLAARLDDPESDRAYWAATLLGRLGPRGSAAVAALARALQDDRALAVRERAAWALGQIGPAAQDALPYLQHSAQNGSTRLAKLAAEAIRRILEEPARANPTTLP